MVLSSLYQLHRPPEKSTKQAAGVSRVDTPDSWRINPKSFLKMKKKPTKTPVSVHRDTVQSLCQLAKLIWLAHAGITEMSDIITVLRGKLKRKKAKPATRLSGAWNITTPESFKNTKNPTQIKTAMAHDGQELKLQLYPAVQGQPGRQGHSPCQEPREWWPQPWFSRPRRSWAESWPRCRTAASGTLTHPCSQNKLHRNSYRGGNPALPQEHRLRNELVTSSEPHSPGCWSLSPPHPSIHSSLLPSQSTKWKAQEHLLW